MLSVECFLQQFQIRLDPSAYNPILNRKHHQPCRIAYTYFFDQPLPDGTPVLVEPVEPLSDFWQCCSLDELAKRQGVLASESTENLLGGWPVEERDDNFEQAFRTWRERELENLL